MTSTTTSAHPTIRVSDLTIAMGASPSAPALVHDLSLEVRPGECVGLVGESGSGKSLTGLSMMRLLPEGLAMRTGEIEFDGTNLASLGDAELRRLRGSRISMIFQDPAAALNPTRTARKQLIDVLRAHESLSRSEADARAISVLESVGFPDAPQRYRAFPFQLSGGLKQRVCIAMALACSPRLVIADEPTTNLDVSVQAGILRLIRHRIDTDGFGCLFVSHDLGVIAEVADRVLVMYAGEVVESGSVQDILDNPAHPYTRGLISAAPTMSSSRTNPLRPYTAARPPLSSSRPPSALVPVDGSPTHVVRVLDDASEGAPA